MLKVRETPKEVLYQTNTPNDLSVEAVASLVADKSVRIEWPRQKICTSVFIELSKKFYVQYATEAQQILFDENIAKFNAKTFDDKMARKIITDTYEVGYASVWRGQLSEVLIQKFRDGLVPLVNGRNTRFVEINGRVAGAILVDTFETYRGKREDHIGWVWIEPSLPILMRRCIGASLLKAAADVAPGVVVAGVYVQNSKSIGFLNHAGFTPICAHLSRP